MFLPDEVFLCNVIFPSVGCCKKHVHRDKSISIALWAAVLAYYGLWEEVI